VPRPVILVPNSAFADCAFLHVRRGDYLLEVCKHHRVDLEQYYRYALSFFKDSKTRILVCSDDLAWCRAHLPLKYGDLIAPERWVYMEDSANDFDTMTAMISCGQGGIAANSTFSWWSGYWNVGRTIGSGIVTMPAVWGSPPLPDPVDLHPSWATILPV
jgi:hypothetical protein